MVTSSIHELLENSSFSEALTLINSDIKAIGANAELIQTKIFCLINLKKFTLALSTIQMAQKRLGMGKDSFIFESAYCLYRLGKFNSALNAIGSKSDSDSRFKLLKGQALYRSEKFEEAAQIFQSFLKNDKFSIEELEINLLAAKSQAKSSTTQSAIKSFDALYNLSLGKLLSGDFDEAEKLANECEQFKNDENVSASDLINSELVSICSLMKSKENWPEAEFLLHKLKTNSNLTPLQNTLISANLMAINKKKSSKNFDIKSIDNFGLFKYQRQQIIANAYQSGISIPHSYLNELPKESENASKDLNVVTIESLKKDPRLMATKKISKPTKPNKATVDKLNETPKGLDKERWTPLRDRSYYKTKDQYQKSIKKTTRKINQ